MPPKKNALDLACVKLSAGELCCELPDCEEAARISIVYEGTINLRLCCRHWADVLTALSERKL
jgi:hypothetical protein